MTAPRTILAAGNISGHFHITQASQHAQEWFLWLVSRRTNALMGLITGYLDTTCARGTLPVTYTEIEEIRQTLKTAVIHPGPGVGGASWRQAQLSGSQELGQRRP